MVENTRIILSGHGMAEFFDRIKAALKKPELPDPETLKGNYGRPWARVLSRLRL